MTFFFERAKNLLDTAQEVLKEYKEAGNNTPIKHTRRKTPKGTKSSTYKSIPKQSGKQHTPCYTKTRGKKNTTATAQSRNRNPITLVVIHYTPTGL
jgi:hypothetical protein